MLGPVFVRTDTSRGIETFFGIINIVKAIILERAVVRHGTTVE